MLNCTLNLDGGLGTLVIKADKESNTGLLKSIIKEELLHDLEKATHCIMQ